MNDQNTNEKKKETKDSKIFNIIQYISLLFSLKLRNIDKLKIFANDTTGIKSENRNETQVP